MKTLADLLWSLEAGLACDLNARAQAVTQMNVADAKIAMARDSIDKVKQLIKHAEKAP